MRETSIEAYRTIKENGLLSRQRFIVYECLFQYGSMTQNECWKKICEITGHAVNKPSVTPSFAPLERMGVIASVGERSCSVSGMKCLVWDVTANLPQPIPKKKSKDQMIKELREDLERLKSQHMKLLQLAQIEQLTFL